jgi:hypothetical protein
VVLNEKEKEIGTACVRGGLGAGRGLGTREAERRLALCRSRELGRAAVSRPDLFFLFSLFLFLLYNEFRNSDLNETNFYKFEKLVCLA